MWIDGVHAIVAVAANIVAILGGLAGLGVWFRSYIRRVVAEPLARIETKANTAHTEAARANARIDNLLIGEQNA